MKLYNKLINKINKMSGEKDIHFISKRQGHRHLGVFPRKKIQDMKITFDLFTEFFNEMTKYGGILLIVDKKRFQIISEDNLKDLFNETICLNFKKGEVERFNQNEEDFILKSLYPNYIKFAS
jgi:hypothetical protein